MKYKTLREMKIELKKLVATIRSFRSHGQLRESWEFRHLHIVYCLLRGRTLDQIENPLTLKNKRDEKHLAMLMEKYSAALQKEREAVAS